ncbi:beta-1,4-mannosyl-glycoprotein 4-beta-N-acetylglucosaminyltransferase-like [Haliotis rufescens]|uniref:beta-1,4-mannosyl-glycoprotein 4-beta-N-acetylglucosaminyltransferase-like n=1 Tax=Haliotis rufescens TaxID=6454 RepID=UPI00201FB23A|nr:beta-1,4-mannosyl-glycoprotein 4-beta-N-acetylglucosaminyltransferase-like [Haliotis rufescens]XP_048254415.1 beta-1,4-mannosyl-glycoprotein 4-beta-N-acetylglucosaminyltransferase-like [Haliotis rufescens]
MGQCMCAKKRNILKFFIVFVYFQMLILFILFLRGTHRKRLLQNAIFTRNVTNVAITYSSNATEHPLRTQKLPNSVYPQRELNASCVLRDNNRWLPFRSGELRRLEQWYSSIDRFFSINNTQPLNLPEDDGPNLYKEYDLKKPWNFTLSDQHYEEFTILNGTKGCFIRGTAISRKRGTTVTCVCASGYVGQHCSVPILIQKSLPSFHGKPRDKPRRLILATKFNMEHHVLMLKMLQVHSAVDLFVILESNYTGHGDTRPLRLLHNLRRGYMKRFHYKIMHVFVNSFPAQGQLKGDVAEKHINQYIVSAIETRVSGLRNDDLFIYMDTDETPDVKLLQFLKLHNGYPFPVGFVLQGFMYGFYWERALTKVISVCSIHMFRDFYKGNVYALRAGKMAKGSSTFGALRTWLIGSPDSYAGWHASWFSSPREVITKLTSAINADFPRWGDYPEKCTFDYVATLFRKGEYFDGKTKFHPICLNDIYVLKDLPYLSKYKGYFNFMLHNPTAVKYGF